MASDDLFVMASAESTGGFFVDIRAPATTPAPAGSTPESPFEFLSLAALDGNSSCLKYVKKTPVVDLPSWWTNVDAMGQIAEASRPTPFLVEVVALGQYLLYDGSLTVTSNTRQATPFITVASWVAVLQNANTDIPGTDACKHAGDPADCGSVAGPRVGDLAVAWLTQYLNTLHPDTLLGLGYTTLGNGLSLVVLGHNLWLYEQNCPPAPTAGTPCCRVPAAHNHYSLHGAQFYPGTAYNADAVTSPPLTSEQTVPRACGNYFRANWTYACDGGGMFLLDNYSSPGSKKQCAPTRAAPHGMRNARRFGAVPADQMLRLVPAGTVNCIMPPAPKSHTSEPTRSPLQRAQTVLDKYKKYITWALVVLAGVVVTAMVLGILSALVSHRKAAADEATFKASIRTAGHVTPLGGGHHGHQAEHHHHKHKHHHTHRGLRDRLSHLRQEIL